MKARDVIKALERDGWRLDRQTGSHRQYRHSDRPGTGHRGWQAKRRGPERYAGGYLAAGRTAGNGDEMTE